MNSLQIVGNLTKPPETRATSTGKTFCQFTVAVNRRKNDEADFFRVTAWEALGANCQKYLDKGRKVAVTGSIRAGAYMGNDGKPVGTLEVTANDVEFLSPKEDKPVAVDVKLPWE